MKLVDQKGREVKRIGSPPLFIIVCVVIFFGGVKADQNSCIRGQAVRKGLNDQALLDLHASSIAWLKANYSRIDRTNPYLRYLDNRAYRDNLKAAHELRVPQLKCSFFFPQVHGHR